MPHHLRPEYPWRHREPAGHLDAPRLSTAFPPPGFPPPATCGPLPYTKAALARAAGRVIRASGRGGGTAAPGKLLLDMAPDAIGRLGAGLPEGSILVSATNGKTTTAGMLASVLRAAGATPVHNRAGANSPWGIAATLAQERGEIGVFEVDEAWLTPIAAELRPRLIVLGNLARDRLDAYGELERNAEAWANLVDGGAAPEFVLCADDPSVGALGRSVAAAGITYFGIDGVDDPPSPGPVVSDPGDGKRCRSCGEAYRLERRFAAHLGHYSCGACGDGRPTPHVAARSVRLRGMSGSTVRVRSPAGELELELGLPGLYNVYNALAAVAAAVRLGAGRSAIRRGLGSMPPVFGRAETIEIGEIPVTIFLIKNPVGTNEVLKTIGLPQAERRIDLWIALNDELPDGRDVSWIWDADFEAFRCGVGRVVCGGSRAAEMALRLKYAGWPGTRIEVVEGIGASLDRAVERSRDRLFALPTYTALLSLRRLLADRGLAAPFWS